MLLDKGMVVDKEAIYDLKKIRRTPAPAPEDDASEQSEDDYLPPTLRSAISISNKSHTDISLPHVSPPLPKRKKVNVRTKQKGRSIRRTKSEKSEKLVPKGLRVDDLAQSFSDFSNHDEKPSNEADIMERDCKSEELRKPDHRGSSKQRRKSENLTPHSIGYRRERGRSRKANPRKETTASPEQPPKPPTSMQRLKSHRSGRPRRISSASMSLDETDVDKHIVDWKRTSKKQPQNPQRRKQSEAEAEIEKQKPKKSTGSSAAKFRRSKSANSMSQSLNTSDNIGPSPRQEQRKRSQLLSLRQEQRKKSLKPKQTEPHNQTPLKTSESSAFKNRNSKSRRNMMLSSKATTPSCRNLLRKIHYMNDERLSKQNQEKKLSPIDDLSRSTLSTTNSTNHSMPDEDANHSSFANHNSFSSFSKPLEESQDSSKLQLESRDRKPQEDSKDCSKPREESKERKPPRTKSDPLNLMRRRKNKSSNSKISRSNSSEKLPTVDLRNAKIATTTPPQKRSIKKSLSGSLIKFGLFLEAKGAKKKNGAFGDETARTGNRIKDRLDRRKPPLRSRSDSSLASKKLRERSSQYDSRSSLRLKKPREGSSQYGLMISMHSLSDEFLSKDSHLNGGGESDVESDDENSFSRDGDDEFNEGVENTRDAKVHEASTQEQTKTVQSSPTQGLTNKAADGIGNDVGSERSTASDMLSMASFRNEATQGGNKKLGDNPNSCAVIVEQCDDILSMTEFTNHKSKIALAVEKTPKKPPSCLQIDFSQLSEHGTTGNILVRSKKLGKKNSNTKSNRKLRVPRSSPALMA